MSTPPELALFIGRFHPLVVHLPIALLLLLALLEALARFPRLKHARDASGVVLTLAVPGAILAAGCGWLLSLGGGYQAQLLQWHKWTGFVTAGLCVVAALLYRLDLTKPYRWVLYFGCAVLLVASHFGGSLTHGSDYLVRYAPPPVRKWFAPATAANASAPVKGPGDATVFGAVVQPIFQQNCVSCHGPEKSKGGLRLDSLQAALKGGENGPAIVPSKPAEGLLLQRVRLPLAHEDHMPPEGKPQPSVADISLLEWWIQNGAPADKKVADLRTTPLIARILQERLGMPAPGPKTVPPKPIDQVLPVASQLADELKIFVGPIAAGEPWLQCNASLAGTNFGDADLARLSPIASNLRWLDLGSTAVGDSGLKVVESMPSLAKLHLERTQVTDAGLELLAGLSQLEYLNLHHTKVTDAGLEQLKSLKNLKQLYLWETQVTPEAAKGFAATRTDEQQIQKWRDDIEQLNARIRLAHFQLEIGAVTGAAGTTNQSPINSECPVSGKPVDRAKTFLQDGQLIAFCCDDCKAKYQKDPKTYVAKLPPLMPKDAKTEAAK